MPSAATTGRRGPASTPAAPTASVGVFALLDAALFGPLAFAGYGLAVLEDGR